jgi:hypothetical protein
MDYPKVKNNGYTCNECKKRTTFTPTLEERGMTAKEAESIFVARNGGRCTNCFLEYRSSL